MKISSLLSLLGQEDEDDLNSATGVHGNKNHRGRYVWVLVIPGIAQQGNVPLNYPYPANGVCVKEIESGNPRPEEVI